MMRRIIGLIVTSALLSACGGGGGSSIPSAPSHINPQSGSMILALKVPAKTSQARAHAARSATPLFQSPAVLGVGMSFAQAPASPPPVNTPQAAFDLSTCSTTGTTTCTQNADGSRTYTVSSPLVALGTYTVVISTWDTAPVGNAFTTGNELSEGTASATVTGTNSAINVTLNGIPKSIVMTPIGGQTHVLDRTRPEMAPPSSSPSPSPSPSPAAPIGTTPTQWSIAALDADGYIIAGDGAPIITFNDPTNSISLSQSSPQTNVYTMKVTQAQPSPIPLSITATYAAQAGPATATTTAYVQPVQELWTTITGVGVSGYALDPNNGYLPASIGCCPGPFAAVDGIATTDSLGAIAQDSNGNIWVADQTLNKIVEYTVGAGSVGMSPTGATIDTSAFTLMGLAADANGFLYGIDPKSASLYVWNVSGTPTLAYTVPLHGSPGNAQGVSVIPSGTGVASGLAGTIMVADANGIDFYTNAKNGAPTYINNAPDVYLAGGTYSASVATDTGLLWTMEGSGGTTTMGVYSISAGPTVASLGASTGSATDEIGYFGAGIANYGYSSGGADAQQITRYDFTPPSTLAYNYSYISAAANTYGLLIVP